MLYCLGLDTVELAASFRESEANSQLNRYWLRERANLREMLETVPVGFRQLPVYPIAGVEYDLYPRGGNGGYAIVLRNDAVGISIRYSTTFKNCEDVCIRFGAKWFLVHPQPEDMLLMFFQITEAFGSGIISDRVHKMDIKYDTQYPIEKAFFDAMRGKAARAFKDEIDTITGRFSGFNNGKAKEGAVELTFYNKTLLFHKEPHWWAHFQSAGVPLGEDAPDIWRVEHKSRHPYHSQFGISSVLSILDRQRWRMMWNKAFNSEALWVPADLAPHCRADRLAGYDPVRRARTRVHPIWERLGSVGEAYVSHDDTRTGADVTSSRLLSGAGCIAGELADSGCAAVDAEMCDVVNAIFEAAAQRGEARVYELATGRLDALRAMLPSIIEAACSGDADRVAEMYGAAIYRLTGRRRKAKRKLFEPVLPAIEDGPDF